MDRKNVKSRVGTLWMLIGLIILVAAVAVTMTACSIFTDAVKGLFSGESSIVGGTENSQTTTPTDSSSSGQGGGSVEPTSEPEDPGIVVTDPVVEVESSYVEITSSLTYDKASHADFEITATHENKDYYNIIGMGLVNEAPEPNDKTVRVISHSKGSSRIGIDGEYLSSLPAGNYYFYYAVYDDSANYYYDPFRLSIVNTDAVPTDVKINYDIECPSVYVTFRCDCGGAHTVSFDSSNYDAVAGATQVKVTKALTKATSHNATVTCVSSKKSASITKPTPDAAAYSKGYLDYKYSFLGHKADGYIEDDAEAADLFEYLAFQGELTEMKVYVSEEIHNLIISEPDAEPSGASKYLASIQSRIAVPWSLSYSCSYSTGSREVTFQIVQTDAAEVLSSGYESATTYRDVSVVSHHSAQNVREKGSDLPIDSKTKVTVRNVKELLAAVAAGYCPEAHDETLTIYNKARDFCYTYLTDEMSVVEKLHVIYDYLAGEIDYDYSALNLYMLINSLSGKTLVTAKGMIDSAIADPDNEFSDSMKTAILAAKDAATDTNDLIRRLKNGYLARLGSFSIEGVLNDGAAVCEGISYTFMLLARIEGIECYQITGYATQNGWVAHAWNKVHFDGKWYCVDATWGNITYSDEKYVSHRYFLVDDSIFYEDHIETDAKDNAAVENLALGDAEYYKSVETASGHTLYASNYSDVKAAVAYYLDGGSDYAEVMIDPAYLATPSDFLQAYKDVTGKSCGYGTSYSRSGQIFLIHYKK